MLEENSITSSIKIAKVVDKIFLLNHNIVSLMLSYKNVDKSKVEEEVFVKLAEYYEELRNVIRETLDIGDEINISEIKLVYKDECIVNEMVSQLREKTKQNIINTITNRIQSLYMSMNFVPIDFKVGNQSLSYVDSVYHGTPEESFRKLEYNSIINSVDQQMIIIEYEDFFEGKMDEQFIISPSISPNLIDTIAERIKYAKAEESCKKLLRDINFQEDVWKKYCDLDEVIEFSESVMVEERYKRMFENSTGLLNSKTNYGDFFRELYNSGKLSDYTGFDKDEINLRLNKHIDKYSQMIISMLRDVVDDSVEKYKTTKFKQKISNFSELLKLKFGKNIKQNYTRQVKNKKSIREIKNNKFNKEFNIDKDNEER